MGILLWIGIGLGIALLANWLLPPGNRNGAIIAIASAILGAIVVGLSHAGTSAEGLMSVSGSSLFFAVGGAMLALLCVHLGKSMLYISHQPA